VRFSRTIRASILILVAGAALVLGGCGSMLPPPRLSPAQSTRVAAAGRLGSVAVDPAPGRSCDRAFLRMLERTDLFTRVVPLPDAGAPTEYVAAIEERCSYGRGGFIPIVSILTLGVVPTFQRFELGYAFSLRDTRSGETIHVPCEIEGKIGVGWIPAAMAVLPGWTQEDPEQSPRFVKRLAYGIISRLPAPGTGR
jgi:hypothetical protein